MLFKSKDFVAGALFAIVGASFCISSLLYLNIGTLFEMGAGYFPLVLGASLLVLGVLIALGASERDAVAIGDMPWRGLVLIIASLLFLGFTAEGLGVVPALATSTFICAYSRTNVGVLFAATLSAAMTMFCVVVFYYALNLPLAPFGPWLAVGGL